MGKRMCFMISILITAAFCFSMNAMAEKKSFKEASGDAARATVNYPANLVNESVNTVGKAVKGTADMVADTGKAVGKTVTGQPGSAPDIVTAPVKGSAETVKNAAVDTVETPVKAGKKTAEQNR
ncbi:MAG: hypothetical protein GF408_01745 [Candidatus Omnitrophica bacterium]|nr:hypothetical protein [Candidatus Omnitrophota bacterium]